MKGNEQLIQVGTMGFDQRTGRIGYQRITAHKHCGNGTRTDKPAPAHTPAVDERTEATALLKDAFRKAIK